MVKYLLLILILSSSVDVSGQDNTFRFMFYNVENLFDTIDNPAKRDEAFTPKGEYHWNKYKYNTKLQHIYKTIMSVKEWEELPLIGLCEIENHRVLNHLLYKTPLYQYNYHVIHQDSPDERGIDVALLYQAEYVEILDRRFISIRFPFDTTDKTRDILYVKTLLSGNDSLHIFLNHWPSRYGGYMQTQPKRNYVAKVLAHTIDTLFNESSESNILIAGDFNDALGDESIELLIKEVTTTRLKSLPLSSSSRPGTLKYRSQWQHFDQIIVSQGLMSKKGLSLTQNQISTGKASFLIQKDNRYQGWKPFRYLQGPKYIGGYSDHLPIFIDIRR